MAVYVAFLRAINLGAKRKFPKDAIVSATEAAGFAGVATYINTGNVRIETTMRSRARIETALEQSYRDATGFEVPTIVFSTAELRDVAPAAERLAAETDHVSWGVQHYVSLLKDEPEAALVREMEECSRPGALARVSGRAAHLLVGENYHQAPLTNATVEKRLGVATNRNLTVVRAVVEKWCG
ncbi:DUF1697 domain-containing protein [Nocardioides sp. R-C-SC26]|uniref:DUF1697 domain-containing protein n=1 Tax=Nocardioides sp. R-C-SC26 TaxID=2870414 RepID=UPI001E2EAA6E|nr:DUF1697 domain-containing protein [Nocardioides sp. R-C-SC26]